MSKQRPLEKLKPRHYQFIHNVVVLGMSQAQAYREAGFTGRNAPTQASNLIMDPLIQAETVKTAKRMHLERHEVELEYSQMIKNGDLRASDKATYLRDYCKLRGWTNDSSSHMDNNKVLDVLSQAIRLIKPNDIKRVEGEVIDITKDSNVL